MKKYTRRELNIMKTGWSSGADLSKVVKELRKTRPEASIIRVKYYCRKHKWPRPGVVYRKTTPRKSVAVGSGQQCTVAVTTQKGTMRLDVDARLAQKILRQLTRELSHEL